MRRYPRLAGVLLDRDGTIVRHVHHLTDSKLVELEPYAFEAIRLLRCSGLRVVVCSNQSVIGLGLCTPDDVDRVNDRMLELLGMSRADFDGILYCPHSPEAGCRCRKPEPGLGLEAARLLGVTGDQLAVVGDQASDLRFARSIGALAIWLRQPTGGDAEITPDFVADDLLEAAEWLVTLNDPEPLFR